MNFEFGFKSGSGDSHNDRGRVTVQYCKTLQRGGGGGYQVVPDSVELHDVPWLTLQPELVKLYEEVAEKANQLFLNCTRYMNL